jgi:thiamine-phosphate pyrophosphorylase
VLSYYVTDRRQFAGTEAERRARLLQTIRKACAAGVDYIQLREQDLAIRELEKLAAEALRAIRGEGATRLLIHHRTDVALAVGADGVHLADNDIAASEARALAAKVSTRRFLIAVSCHSAEGVRLAESHGADFAVLAPIFGTERIALEELREAAQKDRTPDLRVEAGDTRRRFAVFAGGEVNLERATLCAAAGAAGIAGTRLFQECEDLKELISGIGAL